MSFFSKLFKKQDGSKTTFGKITGWVFGSKNNSNTKEILDNPQTQEKKTFWELIGLSDNPFGTKDGEPLLDLSKLIKLPEIKVSAKADEGQAKTGLIAALIAVGAILLFSRKKNKSQSRKQF